VIVIAAVFPETKFIVLVHSIFSTYQGEGPFAGHPSIFIRLAGCNRGNKKLGCHFCDTEFSYALGAEYTEQMLMDALQNQLQHFTNVGPRPLIVLTGGEVGLQWQQVCDVLIPALGKLSFYKMQIETNGDFDLPFPEKHLWLKLTYVVSPKYEKRELAVLPKVLQFMEDNLYLKLLIEDVEDSQYYDVPDYVHKMYTRKNVMLSSITAYKSNPPAAVSFWDESIDVNQTRKNALRAKKLAMSYGMILSFQTHLISGSL
jgi:organic radical activating enzyme